MLELSQVWDSHPLPLWGGPCSSTKIMTDAGGINRGSDGSLQIHIPHICGIRRASFAPSHAISISPPILLNRGRADQSSLLPQVSSINNPWTPIQKCLDKDTLASIATLNLSSALRRMSLQRSSPAQLLCMQRRQQYPRHLHGLKKVPT